MEKSLLVDFGASRIKSAILADDEIFDVQSHPSISPARTDNFKFEVKISDILEKFTSIFKNYQEKYGFNSVFICSEMHGFALVDENNNFLTDYISWKDERCKNELEGVKTIDLMKEALGETFLQKTGLNVRPCYPVFNLYHILRSFGIQNETIKVISLPEILSLSGGKSKNTSHVTMSAGLGFYNINTEDFDEDILSLFKKFKKKIIFNTPSKEVEIGGYFEYKGKNIPIYTGVGDHQCAVLGAGNTKETISLNLGTGSQIGVIGGNVKNSEKRPFFSNETLSVITHIPSGRCLNAFIGFLSEINPNKDFFESLSKISLEEIENSTLEFDMALFSSAWNYSSGGFIKNIDENNLTLKNYLSSLLLTYLTQYEKGIKLLDTNSYQKRIILSGGIPHKLPVIKEYFIKKGYKTEITDDVYEETLIGLKLLQKQATNKAFV